MQKETGTTVTDSPGGTVRREDIRAAARSAGFSLCGIARYRTMSEHLERLEEWIRRGNHGNLGYMQRNRDKRSDPRRLFPTTRSVIVGAVNYRNTAWSAPSDGRPRIASYAYARDYHGLIKHMLGRLLETLQTFYPRLHGRALTDTAPIFEKAWAVEAGLGWIGRNSLLITPQFGSSVLIGELLIDSEADEYDFPCIQNGCGTCTRCLDSCPNGAISADRTIDTARCISRLTIEPDPPATDVTFDNWLFGCDACQLCCPHNSGKPLCRNHLFRPVTDPASMDQQFWKEISPDEFKDMFAGTPLERAGLENILEKAKNMKP